ncbi:MAG TPA: UdgX family uracil-DNA binding protein [Nitrospira sp.]|nr:UdgX family uracil-DNA binding protein [Nitrospira sp.]
MRRLAQSARSFLPAQLSMAQLRESAAGCTGCDLYKHATQTIFGEGAVRASIMFVGEQPGDQEDLAGRPFVGPAGKILDKALAEAGIARQDLYVTNAVKHFKWEPQGKRRKHKKPSATEIAACRPWLEAEIEVVNPRVIVCLGVTAAHSVFGKAVRLNGMRKRPWSTPLAPIVFVTVHPSAVLRHPDAVDRDREYRGIVEDLRSIRLHLQLKAA